MLKIPLFHYIGLSFVILSRFPHVYAIIDDEEQAPEQRNSRVEIRPVLINCRLEYGDSPLADGETSRFHRQELFKHNALHDCEKKLVMAIKILSEPDDTVVDEYIPIEHVFGMNNKRLRLLNPYVLRIRRQSTYETYNIHKINTITGVVTDTLERKSIENNKSKRDLQEKEQLMNSNVNYHEDFENRSTNAQKLVQIRFYKHNAISGKANNTVFSFDDDDARFRREMKVYNEPITLKKKMFFDGYTNGPRPLSTEVRNTPAQGFFVNHNIKFPMRNHGSDLFDERENILQKENNDIDPETQEAQNSKDIPTESITESADTIDNINVFKNLNDNVQELELYDIDDEPNIMFSTRIQLFEKINTPEGKTAWNDITKDETASVSTISREWSNEEFNIRYKSGDWMPRESFSLPPQKLCLVVPAGPVNKRAAGYNLDTDEISDFLIVPQENIIIGDNNMNRENNDGDMVKQYNYTYDSMDKADFQVYPRVGIRASKVLTSDDLKDLKIITKASNPHIVLPFKRTHKAQIDLEAVADDNDVILIGYSGSLITMVSDTRRTRAILDVQAKNTGLAAARFRVVIRECRPEVMSTINSDSEGLVSDTKDVPPYHTRMFHLQVPFVDQFDNARCIVALVNNDDESVAVREVRLKRDDRCFCVWQCDCVCIGEDPKLQCQSMSQSQNAAAGLPSPDRVRYARSVCYPDVVAVNFFVTMLGVLLILLFLGFIKACLGLICQCIGSWGLHLVLQTPRNLDHYYESSLRDITVEYDEEGWPVHPDTKKRTVRLVSRPMEYVLNITFFVILPCIMFWSAVKNTISRCQKKDESNNKEKNNIKKCYSSDVQSGKRRPYRHRASLRRWMSPQAEELTNKIWSNDLHQFRTNSGTRPLIGQIRKLDDVQILDSEQDDTEYVLMEMQKSRVSLDKNQRKLSNAESGNISRKDNSNGF